MDRQALCTALARHADEVLTMELATSIVRSAIDNAALPLPATVGATDLAVLPAAPTREQIDAFEAALLQLPQVPLPLRHHFTPGLYVREMFIAAGTFLTGAAHTTEHQVVFAGDMTVWTEGGMTRLTGYQRLTSHVGAKRVGFAHADSWCTCFFPNPTDTTDVAQLERMLCETPHLLQGNRNTLEHLEE